MNNIKTNRIKNDRVSFEFSIETTVKYRREKRTEKQFTQNSLGVSRFILNMPDNVPLFKQQQQHHCQCTANVTIDQHSQQH